MVERRIIFYHWSSVSSRPPFVPHIVGDKLSKAVADDDYAAMHEGREITTVVHALAAGSEHAPTRFRMLALRSPDNRPLQWEAGSDLAPLPLLDDQYPADVTYVTVWPDNIAAQDTYANAPRLGRLSHFLRNKAGSFVSFDPLYMPDTFDRLTDMKGQLRKIEVALTRPEYPEARRGPIETFVPTILGHRAPRIKVELGMGKYSRRDEYLGTDVDEAVFLIAESAHELVDRLVVRGRSRKTRKVEDLNLLEERVEQPVTVKGSEELPGFPEPDAVFAEMQSAYDSFRSKGLLERATRASIQRR